MADPSSLLLSTSLFAGRFDQTGALGRQPAAQSCDKLTRRANHFAFTEVVSSPKMKNIPIYRMPKSGA